ncbi:probable protein S-acyltransferase 1 [Malania oleifera]|uniref:probable protein S-acyltransferase 1 n=1 Tax=Malania oleifera TaxID=397392 RepID=UPI0025AE95E9|nr:probable protein S-acyltransferase 1 [Malania oleifera]
MTSIHLEMEMGETQKDLPALSDPIPHSELAGTSTTAQTQNQPEDETSVFSKAREILLGLREKFIKIKQNVEERQWVRYGCLSDSEPTRVYQVWPGKNVFFFGGRLVCGPDPRGLVLTTVSIILSSWIFAVYSGRDISNRSGLIISFSIILTMVVRAHYELLLVLSNKVLVNLFLVSTIDPGIIPRNDEGCVEDVGSSSRSRRKRVIINGVEMKLKYCQICRIPRPPRSCHCAVCDNCVERFDHHCPWIGQCIALRNYRFYLMFIITALAFFAYTLSFSCWRIHQRMLKTGIGLSGVLRNCPESLALASFSFAVVGLLGCLVTFHVYLIAVNQTAYENFRQRFVGSKNPYDKGILRNIKEVLPVPLPPSMVDFRAEVKPNLYTKMQENFESN